MSNELFEFTSGELEALRDIPGAFGVFQSVRGKIVPVFLSEQFVSLFGFDSEEQAADDIRRDVYRGMHPDDVARITVSRYQFAGGAPAYDVLYRNKNRFQSDYHIIHETGRHVWKRGTRLDYIIYTDESQIANGEQGVKLHLSESFEQKMSLENDLHRKQFDDLTGLPLIGRFFQEAQEEIHEIRKKGRVPAILWIDYSRLRDYNEIHGFETGDELIRGLAWLIRDQFGVANTARINNDCFVACTDTENLEEDIRHIFDEAAKLNRGNSHPVAVGICVMNEENIGLSAAVDRAKLASDSLNEPMHSSYAYFRQEMLDRAELQHYIIQNYQKAMDEGWIQVYYQPVIRAVTGELCGAEALCRWKDPVYGMISPGQFIPALEEQGRICELDLYMVEKVCGYGRKLINFGKDIVPVSVNLSRKDFREPDLVDRIETLAKKNRIPRELLNIEITESAFVRHTERLSRYISLFHQLGYQVWMDDFGTAYSSLGSLKDLKFDELKIDMSFLSTSTEKARTIITSVVRMAKEIGIQTLAEGVETEEQYEFLKRIGCEKIQGYYFGKPMEKTQFMQHIRDRGIAIEPLRCRRYYDALSRINYQTDEPLCVIEDDGVRLKKLFVNDAYLHVLGRDNIDNVDQWLDEINSDNNPAHDFHRKFADEQLRKLSGPQVMTYPSGDHYMELTGTVVTHHDNYYIYALNIRYIQLNAVSEDEKRAMYVQYIFYMCSDIAVCDLKENALYGLKSNDSSQPIGTGGKSVDLTEAVRIYRDKFIYAPDQERYFAFMDPDTLKERMKQKRGQDLTGFFRSRTGNGEYRWMVHAIMPIPTSDFNRYLSLTLPVDTDAELHGILQDRTGKDRDLPEEKGELIPSLLWKNLETYSQGMYFWKDRDRRFLGASRSFLDYYGFSSEKEIIGKTDEDMHWHVSPEEFRRDELNVLRHGKRIFMARGNCIVRGEQRTILATKIPIYRDGKIVGLMGTFSDADRFYHVLNDNYHSMMIDHATDLLNARGIAGSLRDFLEELWTKGTDFSLIRVHVPEYPAFIRIYGEEAGDTLLRSAGEELKKIFGKKSAIGRITGSYFAILTQDVDPEEMEKAKKRIEEDISSLRKFGEWTCALTARVNITVLNPDNASRDHYAQILEYLLTQFSTGSLDTFCKL